MNCPQNIDWKAYAVGEMSESEKRSAASHLATCESCREEFAGVDVTLRTLAVLRDEEVPRRIAFVSDKVFEPRWWQRMFNPTFASACLVAAAIVFHAVSNQGPSQAQIQAQIDQAVASEMHDRLVILDQTQNQMAQMYKAATGLVTY